MQTTERNISTIDVIIDLIQSNDDIPGKQVTEEIFITRDKWREVKSAYDKYRDKGYSSNDSVIALAKAYRYSIKSIEAIVYSR